MMLTLRKCFAPAMLVALSGLGVSVSGAEQPLATLSNGESVSPTEFSQYLARRVDLKPLARNAWGAENALREMLVTRTLVLEGERTQEPYRGAGKPGRFDDAYGHAVYKKLVKTCPTSVDAAAARKFFDEHPDAFAVPSSVRLARIMLPVSETVSGQSAMAWLMNQATQVARGASSFDEAAKIATTAYRIEAQGDIGWVNLTDEAAVMRALDSAKKGEMVGPLRDGDFAYLFLVQDRRDGRNLTWSEAAPSAANRQIVYCREKADSELTEQLFSKYGVSINHAAVRSLFDFPAAPGKSERVEK